MKTFHYSNNCDIHYGTPNKLKLCIFSEAKLNIFSTCQLADLF